MTFLKFFGRNAATKGALIALLALAGQVRTAELDANAFGTLGLSCFGSNAADYTLGESSQPKGPGRSGECDAGLDSLLALQLNAAWTQQWSSALQIASYRNGRGDFAPELTLAQVRWHPTSQLMIGVGRTYNPSFLHSEYRNARYTIMAARPPPEVYQLLESYSFDGIQLLYSLPKSGWNVDIMGAIGQLDIKSARSNAEGTDEVHGRGGMHLSVSAIRGAWLLNGSITRVRATFLPDTPEYAQLFGALNQFYPDAAQALAIDDKPLWMAALGMAYESDSWQLEGEFAYRTLKAGVRDQYGAYFIAGRHVGLWTPYVGVARRWSAPSVTVDVPGLQTEVDRFLAAAFHDRTSVMLGVSREIGSKFKLKLQADWVNPDARSFGLLNNHALGLPASRPEMLTSANLDFLF